MKKQGQPTWLRFSQAMKGEARAALWWGFGSAFICLLLLALGFTFKWFSGPFMGVAIALLFAVMNFWQWSSYRQWIKSLADNHAEIGARAMRLNAWFESHLKWSCEYCKQLAVAYLMRKQRVVPPPGVVDMGIVREASCGTYCLHCGVAQANFGGVRPNEQSLGERLTALEAELDPKNDTATRIDETQRRIAFLQVGILEEEMRLAMLNETHARIELEREPVGYRETSGMAKRIAEQPVEEAIDIIDDQAIEPAKGSVA